MFITFIKTFYIFQISIINNIFYKIVIYCAELTHCCVVSLMFVYSRGAYSINLFTKVVGALKIYQTNNTIANRVQC